VVLNRPVHREGDGEQNEEGKGMKQHSIGPRPRTARGNPSAFQPTRVPVQGGMESVLAGGAVSTPSAGYSQRTIAKVSVWLCLLHAPAKLAGSVPVPRL
jgi:hypothetical protein